MVADVSPWAQPADDAEEELVMELPESVVDTEAAVDASVLADEEFPVVLPASVWLAAMEFSAELPEIALSDECPAELPPLAPTEVFPIELAVLD